MRLSRAFVVAAVAVVGTHVGASSAATADVHIHVSNHHEIRAAPPNSVAPELPQQSQQSQQPKRTFRVQTHKSVLDEAIAHVAQTRGVSLDIWSVRTVTDTSSTRSKDDPVVIATIYATPVSIQALERAPSARTTDRASNTAASHMRISKHTRSRSSVTTDDASDDASTDWLVDMNDDDSDQVLIATDKRDVAACLNRTDGFLAELSHVKSSVRYTHSAFFDCFRPHEHVFAFFDALAEQNSALVTKLSNVSQTLEGRAIHVYRLSTTTATDRPPKKKKALYTQALLHAREWQGGASTFFALARLVDALRHSDKHITALLDEFDWYFVPIVNIDGYAYATSSTERYWRTNRRTVDSSGAAIDGVDLNRNFGPSKYFNRKPETNDAETYPGEFPLSEPSTAGIFTFLLGLDNLSGVVDVHGYGGQVLRPFSNGAKAPPKPLSTQLKLLSDNVAASISKHTTTTYASETGAFLYEAFGCFDDSVFLQFNYTVPAITIEVEGDDFIAPQDSIRAIGESIYHGLVRFAHEVSVYHKVAATTAHHS